MSNVSAFALDVLATIVAEVGILAFLCLIGGLVAYAGP